MYLNGGELKERGIIREKEGEELHYGSFNNIIIEATMNLIKKKKNRFDIL